MLNRFPLHTIGDGVHLWLWGQIQVANFQGNPVEVIGSLYQSRYISFAGDQRKEAEAIAQHLKTAGIKVFYDDYQQADLWGKNLYDHLAVCGGTPRILGAAVSSQARTL